VIRHDPTTLLSAAARTELSGAHFFNQRGLRAGWRLLIYMMLCLVGLIVIAIGSPYGSG